MEEMPDLSHLSQEERQIIELVLQKQKIEEASETKEIQKADEELDQIEKQINERKESARRLVGTQDDAICQICQKTKFADGIGHKCFYCQLRSCTRCGGRAQSKNKAIWACSLCQKKQKILAKTGKWFQPDEVVQPKTSGAGMDESSSPVPSISAPSTSGINPQIITPTTNQQPRTNGPQAHHEQPRPTATHTDPHGRPGILGNGSVVSNGPVPNRVDGRGPDPRRQNTLNRQPTTEIGPPRQANGVLPNQTQKAPQPVPVDNRVAEPLRNRSQASIDRGGLESQRLREEEERRTSQLRNNTGNQKERRTSQSGPFSQADDERRFDGRITDRDRRNQQSRNDRSSPVRNGPFDARHVDEYAESPQPSTTTTMTNSRTEFRRTRSIREDDGRRGSIGVRLNPASVPATSSVSTEVPSVPIVNQTHRQKKTRLHRQIRSMSSSDEEQPSTSEGFTGEEARQRVPNECTSEKGMYLLRYIYGSEKAKNGRKCESGAVSGYSSETSPRTPRTVPTVMPGNILAAKIRTYLSHPVTWQPSADQRRLIGHMVLHRTDSAANGDLGLKVVGGRRSDTGRLGAFVTRVKHGSVADTVGRLRPGDEVLEWNGQPLQNATFDQVYEIISASKHESHVELIVSRSACVPGGDDFLNMQPIHTTARHLPNPQFVMGHEYGDSGDGYSPGPSPLVPPHSLTHSQSAILQQHASPLHRQTMGAGYYAATMVNDTKCYGRGQLFGQIELCLYFSHHDRQLTVTVERAFDLPPRPDGSPRNPYVKLFLLPDRGEKSRRQSKVLAETTVPVWAESFYYQNVTEPLLMDRALEVTVWDYDKYDTNSFLGETLVDFSMVSLDGQPMLYTLVDMDDENPLRTRLRQRKLSQYSGLPQRPRSEMGYGYNQRAPRQPVTDYVDSYDRGPPDVSMRRSRTYDRTSMLPPHGRMTPVRAEEDWSMNQSSQGYLSDHGYSKVQPRYRQRRPRSATAMRPMTAAEMSASRMYPRTVNEQWEDDATPEQRYPPSLRYPSGDPRSPNGRLVMEAMQEQQGYGSDGSETLSINSAHSMPHVRTINRRMPLPNGGSDHQEQSMEEYMTDELPMGSQKREMREQQREQQAQQQQMKERKKSLMTRFIPGRQAGAEAKRTGFARSEEVGIPGNLSADRLQAPFLKQASKESNDSGDNWLPVLPDGPLGTFVDNLGPGQVVGRQVLASPVLGEIQIALMGGRSGIEVEIIRATNLVVKPGTKISPAPYVKVYLMEGKNCLAKAKTNPAKRTTSPLIQQRLQFNENPKKKMLQITVLGDYGRMERKVFMGITQIRLDDIELGTQPVTGWYKLFHSSSLAGTGPIRKDSETSLGGQPQQ